jgi:DNA-binding LytR/AlgR family response regulator
MENDRKKILIIDDSEELRTTLSAFLSAGGFNVEAVADGDQGLEVLWQWKPDLVILDLRMPGKAGWEVMRDIRAHPDTEDLPVILLTAVRDEHSKVLGFRSGADDYLEKPFQALELVARIDRILETRGKLSARAQNARTVENVPVRIGDKITFVGREDIFYIKAAGKYSYIYTSSDRFLSDCSLKEIEEGMLGKDDFFRVHRSYLVNLNKIAGVTKESPGKYIVELGDDSSTMIYVSQRRLPRFKEILHLH